MLGYAIANPTYELAMKVQTKRSVRDYILPNKIRTSKMIRISPSPPLGP
jgi:hypothetical protein